MTDYKLINFSIKVKQPAINVITYSKETHYIAIGRETGLVEIYDASQNYLSIAKIVVSNINAVDALEFIYLNGCMMLVGLAASKLFIIDISKNCISYESFLPNNVNGRSVAQCGEMLAVGCDSGYLCLYEYTSELKLTKIIRDIEQTILSLAWSIYFKNFLFAGSIDKVYRIDLKTDDVQYFDVGRETANTETIVWCTRFVQKNLCTGDSRGIVTVWDPTNFGILERYKTHDVDIVSMATGNNYIYVSGTDPTIVTIDLEQKTISTKLFGMTGSVRGICTFDKSIVAVGTEGEICVYEVGVKSETTNTKFMKIDQSHQYECHLCKLSKSSVLFSYNNKAIEIYELSHRVNAKGTMVPHQRQMYAVYARKKNHIQAWSVSDDLCYLAYSTNIETIILKMSFTLDHDDKLSLRIKRFNAPDSASIPSGNIVLGKGDGVSLRPSNIIKFARAKECLYLIVVESFAISNLESVAHNNSKLCIYDMVPDCRHPVLKTSIIHNEENYFNNIHKLEISLTGGMIAFSTIDGSVFVYSLEQFSILMKVLRDEMTHNANKPRVTAMAFNSTNKRLIVIYTNRQIHDISIAKHLKTAWCHKFNNNMPTDWLQSCNVRELIPVSANKFLLLIGKRVIAKLDMEKKIPDKTTPLFVQKKRTPEFKLQLIKRELTRLHIKVAKLNNIKANFEKLDKADDVTRLMKKVDRFEKRMKEMQSIDLAAEDDCSFTWHTEKNHLIGVHYLAVGHILVALNLEKVGGDSKAHYSKKIFGL